MLYAGNSSGKMNSHKYYLNKLRIAIYSVLLLLFMILSANIDLPLKCRFPVWKLSPICQLWSWIQQRESAQTIFGSNDKITVALDKNYATVIRILDKHGNCVLEQCFDNYGRPAVTAYGDHALSREYNSDSKCITSTHVSMHLTVHKRFKIHHKKRIFALPVSDIAFSPEFPHTLPCILPLPLR